MLQTSTEAVRPHLPTLAEIQQRRAELLGLSSQPQGHTEPQAPVPRQPSPVPAPESPLIPPSNPGLKAAAFYGVAGLAVRALAPHSEAHPAAILLQLLAAFGNLAGRGPHCMVDATRHGLNLFVVLVGDSSKARKGTSWNQIARLFSQVDEPWLSTRVSRARLTAGGLLAALHDRQPPADRRLLALSEEFASVLCTLKRGNGHLSPLLRCAWDSGHLPALDLNQRQQVTETHLSLIAHITQRELTRNLLRTEAHNGFANRCLWTWVRRSNCLPEGGSLNPDDLTSLAREIRGALDWVNATPEILFRRDAAARDLWQDRYPILSQLRPGLRGAATSRAEAQVLRLSAIYAALDSTSIIGLPHLQAAFAVWDYCYASACFLFGMSTGEPIADRIREAVEASEEGLSREQIRRIFHGHVEGGRIDAALQELTALGVLITRRKPTRGRPSSLWAAAEMDEQEENAEAEWEGEESAEEE